ncbi:hypothetical protein PMAYCL1PPCAC_14794, partial [Pristionchus mayeri]
LRGSEDQSDDHTVETEHLKEDKDEDHSDEETRLLGGSAHSGISDDSDGVTGTKTAEAAGQACCQMRESLVEIVVLTGRLDLTLEHHSHDQTVDTDDTRHNDGDDGLHDELWPHHSHGTDADGRLGGTVRGSQ